MKSLKIKITTLVVAGIFVAGCAPAIKTSKPCFDASATTNDSAHNECGFKIPSLEGYRGVENIYVSIHDEIPQWAKNMYKTPKFGGYCPGQFSADEKHSLAYKVTFKNKDKIIEKFYHKTKLFAFTIKESEKETYTILADRKMGTYSTMIPGELKCEKYDASHWAMKHPEPDDYNPNTGDPFPERDSEWWKACEWHRRTE